MDIVRVIFAILLPPVGVFLQVGLGGHFWLCPGHRPCYLDNR